MNDGTVSRRHLKTRAGTIFNLHYVNLKLFVSTRFEILIKQKSLNCDLQLTLWTQSNQTHRQVLPLLVSPSKFTHCCPTNRCNLSAGMPCWNSASAVAPASCRSSNNQLEELQPPKKNTLITNGPRLSTLLARLCGRGRFRLTPTTSCPGTCRTSHTLLTPRILGGLLLPQLPVPSYRSRRALSMQLLSRGPGRATARKS